MQTHEPGITTSTTLLFASQPYHELTREIGRSAGLERSACTVGRFSNHELFIQLEGEVESRACIIVGSAAPPAEQLLELLLLADTLEREGAGPITVIAPYLAYSRHDKPEAGKSLAARWLGKLMKASGVERLVTVDLHNADLIEGYPIELVSLSPVSLWKELIDRDGLADAIIIAPDRGAIARCDAVRRAAGIETPVTHFEKTRTASGVSSVIKGAVGKTNVIIDDILDTGATLIQACSELKRSGAGRIVIMVTHGLFTAGKWKALRELGVERIYTTDTVPAASETTASDIVRVGVGPILSEWFNGARLAKTECASRQARAIS